jgi:ribonuclease HIII
MNKLKAILHNKVLMDLTSKYESDYVVVDQFAKEKLYYSYLKESSNVVRGITFMTKAEDKVLSVACASMISRFIFLKEFDKLGESIGSFLPKGAGDKVDLKAADIVRTYGFEKLNEIAKMNFKNTEKVKALLEK